MAQQKAKMLKTAVGKKSSRNTNTRPDSINTIPSPITIDRVDQLDSNGIIHLQRTLGNQQVLRLIQRFGSSKKEKPSFKAVWKFAKEAAESDPHAYLSILRLYDMNWFIAKEHLAYDRYVPSKNTQQYEERMEIMRGLLEYRKMRVDNLLKLTMEQLAEKTEPGCGAKAEKNSSDTGYKIEFGSIELEAFALGSTSITSDYDITFSAPKNEEIEVEAVELFNEKFRSLYGVEAGVFFDTNVYTTGFMPDKSDDKLEYKDKFNDNTQDVSEFKTHKHRLQMALSLLPILQHLDDSKDLSGRIPPKWIKFQSQAIQQVVDYVDKALNDENTGKATAKKSVETDLAAIFMLTESFHNESKEKRSNTEKNLKSENKNLSDEHIAMMAGNQLYQDQLNKVKKLLIDRKRVLSGIAETTNPEKLESLANELADIIIQFEIEQGLALVYANEAYFSGGPAIHVVLGMQGGNTIELGRQRQMQSLLMNIGYKLAHFEHQMHASKGRALVGTAKYGQRVRDLIRRGDAKFVNSKGQLLGNYKTGVTPNLYTQLTDDQLQMLENEEKLIVDYKKSSADDMKTPQQKENAAARDFKAVSMEGLEANYLDIAQKIMGPFYVDRLQQKDKLW